LDSNAGWVGSVHGGGAAGAYAKQFALNGKFNGTFDAPPAD